MKCGRIFDCFWEGTFSKNNGRRRNPEFSKHLGYNYWKDGLGNGKTILTFFIHSISLPNFKWDR